MAEENRGLPQLPGIDLDTLQDLGGRKRVLIIDDDPDMVDLLKLTLRKGGLDVAGALNAQDALEKTNAFQPDIILLDLMMPEVDGWETMRRLRQVTDVPVVIVSAKGDQSDIVKGLDVGADDYVPKPFHPPEVVSRVNAVLRRSAPSSPITSRLFPELNLVVNFDTREVFLGDMPILLSPKEYAVLSVLASQAPKPVPYLTIAEEVWENDSPSVRNRLRWIVHKLRQKLEKNPLGARIIINRSGHGYQLNAGRLPQDQA